MPEQLQQKLQSQGYHLLGDRGAFKACQWQRRSLLDGETCYKQRFYGIQSHRCLQMTPVVDKCTQNCQFCWRVTPSDLSVSWDQINVRNEDVLQPSELLELVFRANLQSLGGYNPEAGANVSENKYHEARNPRHVAISLSGEPTLYPFLGEFIELIKNEGMTSFLVSNGTKPEVLMEIHPPTQLYITLAAPDESTYQKLCRPLVKNGWQSVVESQRALASIDTRTVNRLTMVKGLNMHNPRSYAKLILEGEPDFIEVKGYMFLGSSRDRLDQDNAPSHRDIQGFSEKLADLTGYYLTDEQIESRVVLLSKKRNMKKLS
ncbi:MAG: S-adenosyl-L-methionine-dependent tRNA 4-demethylwyosine synthase [Candidatus Thorarchaeota archaeon]|nr:MAG: S-adenosyl-L-methionine-dependent tRNA 4-demethylwyosine synthase [Candidatus Thorarchaeota archaeon]